MLSGKRISLTTAASVSFVVAIVSAAVTWGRTANQIQNLERVQEAQQVLLVSHDREIIEMQVQLKEQYTQLIYRLDRIEKKIDANK